MTVPEFPAILGELEGVLREIEETKVLALEERISTASRIYAAGAGRTGFVMRAFAMRLMHLGLEVHVVGEVTTPAIEGDDLLIIGSGSGETPSLVAMARRAREIGAGLALLTTRPASSIGQLAQVLLPLDAPTPKAARPEAGARSSIQPMGSLFEQALFILLDAVVLRLARERGASFEEMFGRHANLE